MAMHVNSSNGNTPALLTLLNPLQAAKNLWAYRGLIAGFAKREFENRHKQSFLGVIWSVLVPLIMLCAYTFVFSIVFQARWGNSGEGGRTFFALVLFASLIPFNFFSEVVSSSPSLILANQNLVKKVMFPLEILPLSRVFSVAMQMGFSFIVLFIALFIEGRLSLTALYLPILLCPLALITLGLSYIVASLTVFIRDLAQVVGVTLTLLMFLTPIFYPIDAVPEAIRGYIALNPMALMIEQFRQILIFGHVPNLEQVLLLWVLGGSSALFGYAWFVKSKSSFADVL